MNNVWTSIACRAARGAARPSRNTPLLQLFHGYNRQHCVRNSISTIALQARHDSSGHLNGYRGDNNSRIGQTRTFRNASPLLAKKKQAIPPSKHVSAKAPPPEVKPFVSRLGQEESTAQPTQQSEAVEVVDDTQNLTWRDYDPEGGMPLPQGELSAAEIHNIFGKSMNVDTGNYILSVMHWRRLSGALIDVGLEFPADSGVDVEQAERGLQYVRTIIPQYDELEAGQIWSKEESERLEGVMIQKAVKLGLYKPKPEQEPLDEDEQEQGTEYGRERSGQSVLQATRAQNERLYEEELAQKKLDEERAAIAAVHAARGPLELLGGVQPETPFPDTYSGSKSLLIQQHETRLAHKREQREARLKQWEEAALVDTATAPPNLTIAQRLLPSLAFLLLILALSYTLATTYTPPPQSARLFPDTPPAITTLTALTILLTTTFILSRIPPLWRLYNTYLTLVPARPYTLSILGSSLRHDGLRHLASNVLALWLFGTTLHDDVGRGAFLAVVVAGAATGGYASLMYNVLRKQWSAYIVGSSGAVLAVVGAVVALRPTATFSVVGYEVPVATWVVLAAFAGMELVAAVRGIKTMMDHAGHLGGMALGVLAGCGLKWRAGKSVDGKRVVEVDVDGKGKELRDRLVEEVKGR